MMTYETYSFISIFCIFGISVGVLMMIVCGIASIITQSYQTERNMAYSVIAGIVIVVTSVATAAISQQLWRMALFSGTS